MARKKTSASTSKNDFTVPALTIKDVDISDEIETMFVPFAHYSIADRAIPSVLDGLKPSQRRILWCMSDSGFHHDKPFVKSSRISGAVIGSWHPHGDASVYATMANMVKPYILTIPLVTGKGSYGFVAGDTESAARYTEARLAPISDLFIEDVKFNAVDMQPNFDERLEEPVVLPVTIPLLPINGASGIAVGFATNCAPHNPGEIIDATIERVQNPKMTIDDLLAIVPGPDFPTGCDIIGIDGIREAYTTGRGIVKQRAKYRIETATRGRHIIEFYEIPYNISPEKIIADIVKFNTDNPTVGITDVMDLMDKENPVRIAVYVKSGINAATVAEMLIDASPSLYCTFAINQTALLNNVPRVFSMMDMLDCFIDFRRDVITRRTSAKIAKVEHDKKLQEALAAVLLDIDEVISIFRNSDTNEQVYTALKKRFKVNDEQARYIGDMRLIQLKRKDKLAIDQKIKAFEQELKRLRAIIKSKASLNKQLVLELEEAKKLVDKPRKSQIIDKTIEDFAKTAKRPAPSQATGTALTDDLVVSGETTLLLAPDGKVMQTSKRTSQSFVQKIEKVDLHSTVLVLLEDGNSIRTKAYELPTSPGIISKKCVGLIDLGKDAVLDGIVSMITSDGLVKNLKLDTLTKNDECPVMSVNKGAKILAAAEYNPDSYFVFVTSAGNILKFKAATVNPQGRTSAGVAGIKLVNDAKVVYATIASESDILVTTTGKTIKQTLLSEYPEKGRGAQGVRCHKFLKGEDSLTQAFVGVSPVVKGVELPALAARDASGKAVDGLGSNLSISEK